MDFNTSMQQVIGLAISLAFTRLQRLSFHEELTATQNKGRIWSPKRHANQQGNKEETS